MTSHNQHYVIERVMHAVDAINILDVVYIYYTVISAVRKAHFSFEKT